MERLNHLPEISSELTPSIDFMQQIWAVQSAVTGLLTEQIFTSQTLHNILGLIGDGLACEFIELWEIGTPEESNQPALYLRETWHNGGEGLAKLEEISYSYRFLKGVPLPGCVWERQTLFWEAKLDDDLRFWRSRYVSDTNIKGALGIPLRSQGECIGVLMVFTSHTNRPSVVIWTLLQTIANQIAQVLDKIPSTDAVESENEAYFPRFSPAIITAQSASQVFLNSLLNSLPVGVSVKDAENFKYVYWNAQASEIFGYDQNMALHKTVADFLEGSQSELLQQMDQRILEQHYKLTKKSSTQLRDSGQTTAEYSPEALQTEEDNAHQNNYEDGHKNDHKINDTTLNMLTFAHNVVTPHRGTRCLQFKKLLILQPDGSPRYILTIFEDISDHLAAQKALQESESRFRSLAANIPGMIYQYRIRQNEVHKGEFSYISPYSQELFGYTPAEMQAASPLRLLTSLIDSQERQSFEESLMMATLTGQPWVWTGKFHHRSGEERWLQGVARPQRSEDGDVIWDGLMINISEQKRLDHAIANSEQRLSLLVRSTPLAVIEWNCKSEVLEWNPAAEKIFGYRRADVIGHTAVPLLTPHSSLSQVENVMNQLFQGAGGTHLIIQNMTREGKQIICEWHNAPTIDLNGKAKGVISIVQDITDRIQAEEALRTSAAQLRFALRAAQLQTWYWDIQNNQIIWSEGLGKLFGLPANAVPEGFEAYTQLIHPEDRPLVMKTINEAFQHQSSYVVTHRVIWEDGSVHWIEGRGDFIYDDLGMMNGLIGTAMDITERQNIDEQIRSSEAKFRQQAQQLEETLKQLGATQAQLVQTEKMSSLGQLVAGVAHEINNPVNFIYGNLKYADSYIKDLLNLVLLYQEFYPEPVAAIANRIEEIDLEFLSHDLPKLLTSMRIGAERIQEIVASLRNFSRMDEAELKPVNIHDGINSTILILQSKLKLKGTRPIEVVKKYGDLPNILCHAGQLNQVFMNLITNAIDAIEEQIQLTGKPEKPLITITTDYDANETVHIRIQDNGCGVPEPMQHLLFNPFFTTKAVGKGTGLGLSISYQIITQKHRGKIYCESAVNQGTTFIIELPRL
jgi:PAS domain S-box-containing protein